MPDADEPKRDQYGADLGGQADALIMGAGVATCVESGSSDLRGDTVLWHAYQAFDPPGLKFREVADPKMFDLFTLAAGILHG